jgi:hypothetical protein
VVISLQTLLEHRLTVGGRTALELQGYAHYLAHRTKEVHLYGPERPPTWLSKLRAGVRFHYHNSQKLFPNEDLPLSVKDLVSKARGTGGAGADSPQSSFLVQPWGQWDWPLTLSTPERAVLELLDELPERESFHQVDKLMEGLSNLSPNRVQGLLLNCRSVKVKRLFLLFADRHQHAWAKRIKKEKIDLGTGKRMLVEGGRLNSAYQITVPEDFVGLP